MATLRQGIDKLEKQIGQAARAHPDFPIFDSFSGAGPALAPRRGKTEWVHFRRAWPKFLRQTFRAAVRSLAFKWIRPAFRCWQDRVPYDDARYVASLHRHGSPLAAGLALKKPGQIPLDRITQKTS